MSRELENRQEEQELELERRHLIQKERQQQIEEERFDRASRKTRRTRAIMERKTEAELLATQKKRKICSVNHNEITKIKNNPLRWHVLHTSIHGKPISAEEKFGYLLGMVSHKVREKIANLKPGEVGYKVAWERLKVEYGQTKQVVSAHLDEIVNLPVIKGSNYTRIQEFYEALSSNYDALQTLGEATLLKGFVLSTINKLPQVKPDLVRTDDAWESLACVPVHYARVPPLCMDCAISSNFPSNEMQENRDNLLLVTCLLW